MNPSPRGTAPGSESGTLPGVRLVRDGPVATLTLCRPNALNAQTVDMVAVLRSFGVDLPGDVRVVVVRGEGSAVHAIARLGDVLDDVSDPGAGRTPAAHRSGTPPADEADQSLVRAQQALEWLGRPDLISVSALSGDLVGPAAQIALACDLRLVTEWTTFRFPEVGAGDLPVLGAPGRLVTLVGYARALEICVTGRRISSAEADRWGLVNAVLPGPDLDTAVDALTAAVVAAPRATVIETKAILLRAAGGHRAGLARAERAAWIRTAWDRAGLGE